MGSRRAEGEERGCLGLSCWPLCLPYGCSYLCRRISILKLLFVLGTGKRSIVRPEKDLDKIRTVSIQDSLFNQSSGDNVVGVREDNSIFKPCGLREDKGLEFHGLTTSIRTKCQCAWEIIKFVSENLF